MTALQRDLPAEGLSRVEIEVWRGSLSVRGAGPGEAGLLQCDGDLEVAIDGDVLRARQPAGLARLLGDQHVRLAIEGKVLFDQQIGPSSGNVAIVLPVSVRELRCHTDSGDIDLELPTAAEVRIDAATRHGRIETDLPLVKVGSSGPEGNFSRRLVGALGTAEPRATLVLRTGRGNVRITRAPGQAQPKGDPDQVESPTEPQADRHGDPDLAVLEALRQGDLSVDEALTLLDPTTRPEEYTPMEGRTGLAGNSSS